MLIKMFCLFVYFLKTHMQTFMTNYITGLDMSMFLEKP
jgi:hypothetical protein